MISSQIIKRINMRYYIADCHFYHRNLLTHLDNRPFESIEEMNSYMIKKWNEKVRTNDDVVVLGDLSFGNGEETNEVLSALNGRIYLIKGNHDGMFLDDRHFNHSRLQWVKDYEELNDNKMRVILMHYPVFCYNGQNKFNREGKPKTYMLYGHVHNTYDQVLVDSFISETRKSKRVMAHGTEETNIPCQMINCFTMYSDYTPLSLDEWIESDRERRQSLNLE